MLESAEVIEIKSSVPGETTILTIVPEGTEVKQGDQLVQLDSAALKEQRVETLVEYESIRAQVQAQDAKLKSLRDQAKLEIEVAELKLQTAKLAQERYVDGELPAELDQIDRLLAVRKRQHDSLQQATQIPRGPNETPRVTPLAVHEARLEIERLETQKQLLQEYKSPHQKSILELAVAEAQAQLHRIQRASDNEAREIEATLKAEEVKLAAVKQKLESIDQQIAACSVTCTTRRHRHACHPSSASIECKCDAGWDNSQRTTIIADNAESRTATDQSSRSINLKYDVLTLVNLPRFESMVSPTRNWQVE